MQIFLDTNIILNYLKGSKSDEIAFPKLLNLLLKKKIVSLATDQVYDEYIRNSTNLKNEKIKKIEGSQHNISFRPINYKSLKLFNQEVKKNLEKINKDVTKQKKDILKEKVNFTKREKNIKVLFEQSLILSEDYETIKKAELRYLKGNPPRKKKEKGDSYGDAINWELILRDADKKDDLSIISFDGDYSEQLYGVHKLNSLLSRDWKKESRKKIKLFTTIGEFVNYFAGKEVVDQKLIDIEKENIKEEHLSKRTDEKEEYITQRLTAFNDFREKARSMLSVLSPREQKVLDMRFGLIGGIPHSYEEVGQEFEVSGDLIREIESKALKKIKKSSDL